MSRLTECHKPSLTLWPGEEHFTLSLGYTALVWFSGLQHRRRYLFRPFSCEAFLPLHSGSLQWVFSQQSPLIHQWTNENRTAFESADELKINCTFCNSRQYCRQIPKISLSSQFLHTAAVTSLTHETVTELQGFSITQNKNLPVRLPRPVTVNRIVTARFIALMKLMCG